MKISLALFASILLGLSVSAAEIIFTERRDDDSFKRISEYLTGEENPGRYVIARTDPSQRNGYYVALKLSGADQPRKAESVRIQFVRPGTQDIEEKMIEVGPIKKQRLLVGLTDGTWGASDMVPLTWRIEILDTNESILSSSQSFLWSSEPISP